MKLHLPKQLFTALLAALTLAAPATLSLGSSAWGGNPLYVPTGGGFFAGDYAFTFTVTEGLLTSTNTNDVLAYYGNNLTGTNYHVNAYVLNYDSESGSITLSVGDGYFNGALDTNNAIKDSTTFESQRGASFETALTAGETYLVKVTGANQNQTVSLINASTGATLETKSYNGNMNDGKDTTTMATATYASYSTDGVYLWSGSAESNTLELSNFAGTSGKELELATTQVLFGESGHKTVDMSGEVSTARMVILDSYTFNATAATTLSATNGLFVGTGGSLTLKGAEITLANTVTNNGTLTITSGLKGSATLVLNEGSNLLLDNGGTIAFNNKTAGTGFQASGTGTITIGDGTVVNLTNEEQVPQGAIAGHVVVLGGGELRLSGGKTLFGYDAGGTKSVTLRGTEGKTALMNIKHATTTDTQHLSTDLILAGYATIQSAGSPLETYVYDGRGNITATGTNNLISANITLNRELTVTVTEATDALEISGQITSSTGQSSKAFTKAGEGTLTLSSAGVNSFSSTFTQSAGVTNVNAQTTFGTLVLSGGELNIGNTASITTLNATGNASLSFIAGNDKTITIASARGTGKLAVDIASGTTVQLNGGSIYISEAIANAGTLTLAEGTKLVLDPTAYAGETSVSYSGGAVEGNGFAATSYDVVTGVGTLTNAITVSVGGQDYTTSDGVITVGNTTFHVRSGEETYTGVEGSFTYGATAFNVAENAVLTLNTGGEVTYSTSSIVSGGGTLRIADGTTLKLTRAGSTSAVSGSKIEVAGGGKLILDDDDLLGWDNTATKAIELLGTSDKMATLELGGRQTQTTDITMSGNAQIVNTSGKTGSLNPFKKNGARLNVTGQNNTFSANIEMRDALLIDVGLDGELEVSGTVSMHSGTAQGTDAGLGYDTGNVVKKGYGELEFSGSGNTFANKYVNMAGKTLISGGSTDSVGSTFNSGLDVSGGTFEVSGSATINGAVTNSGALTVSGGTATINGAVTNSGALTVSGGTAEFTNALTMNQGTSLNVSGGAVTIAGALTVAGTGVSISQSGSGALVLTTGATVNEGAALNLSGAFTLMDTITNSGSVTFDSKAGITVDHLYNFEVKQAGSSVYVVNDTDTTTSNTAGNGFVYMSAEQYWLVKGGSTNLNGVTAANNASYELKTTTQDDEVQGVYFTSGSYVQYDKYYISTGFTANVDSTLQAKAEAYVLQGGTMNITGGSVNTSLIEYTSGSVTLASGARLTLDVADNSTTATHWLTDTSGVAGSVIEIAANANFGEVSDSPTPYSTAFAGKWVVTDGATLKLGGLDGGWNRNYSVDLQNLEALELDGGNLRYFGGNSTLGVVNVKQAGTLTVYEMCGDDKLLTINDLNLTANLTLDTTWRSRLDIKSLSGAGNLIINNSSSSNGNGVVVKVNATDDFTGYLDINCGTHAKDAVNISTDTNATVSIKADSASTINKLTLADGATLNYLTQHGAYEYTIKEVEVSGDATISMCPTATWWQGAVHIESLTSDVDENNTALSRTLTLSSNFRNDARGVFNLKGGNYYGTISFEGESGTSSNRNHVLNIKSGAVAADAIVNVSGNENSIMSLGIGDATVTSVTVKGLTGIGTIYSGEQAYGGGNTLASDGTQRTLIIDTDGSGTFTNAVTTADYSSSATIQNDLNLQKEGTGSQTFSGDTSAFDGAVTVNGGTLAFTNSGNLDITTATVAADAGLTLGGATTVGTMSSAGTVTLNSGASLALAAGTAEAQKEHSISTLTTAAGAGVKLGDYASLELVSTQPNGYAGGDTGNTDSTASLELAISGGTGSVLKLNMATSDGWQYNNTVKLSALTGETKTVDEVHVSGVLAADVYSGTASTDLGGAKLVMADASKLELRKNGVTVNFGAGDIELQGATTMELYGESTSTTRTLTNNISGDTLETASNGAAELTGSVDLKALHVGSSKVTLAGGTDKKLQELSAASGKETAIAAGTTLQMVDAQKATKVSFSSTDKENAATMTAESNNALARLQEDASFTIEDMTLMNTTITAANVDTQVNLKNVSGNATLKTGTFALQVSANAPGNVGMSLSYAVTGTPSLTLASATEGDTKLVIAADPTADVSGAYGTYTLTFNLNLDLDDSISGNAWEELVGFEGWLGTMLENQGATATYTYLPADEVEVAQVDAGTSTPTVSYTATPSVGTLVITITGLNVPEPTTSTLSLLALAALAARRRRND